MRSKNVSIVKRFLNALHSGFFSSLCIISRLETLLTCTDWEAISETYYIPHLTDLILSSVIQQSESFEGKYLQSVYGSQLVPSLSLIEGGTTCSGLVDKHVVTMLHFQKFMTVCFF